MFDALLPHAGGCDLPGFLSGVSALLGAIPPAVTTFSRAVVEPLAGGASGALPPSSVAATAAQIRANFPLALLLSLLAGASTGLGGVIMVLQTSLSTRKLGVWQGAAAGFMCSVSLFELLPGVVEELGLLIALVYTMAGVSMFLAMRHFIPEPDLGAFATTKLGPAKQDSAVSRQVLFSGIVTALGVSVHNVPEGVSVCLASLRGIRVGLPLALAIAAHNIPEGLCVAMPVYYATLDKWYAVRLAFYSGMAEPFGVVLCYVLLEMTGIVLTSAMVAAMLGAVAGVMLCICAVELIPQSRTHCGNRLASASCGIGLASMTVMLGAIDYFGVAPH